MRNLGNDICNHLKRGGWEYSSNSSRRYDRQRALIPADIVAWVERSQPAVWMTLFKSHGELAEQVLMDRLADQLNQRGTLDVLRFGIELAGIGSFLRLCQFESATAPHTANSTLYQSNQLRVVRQLKYSLQHEKNLDLVLLLNGIPVATALIATDITHSTTHAVAQYQDEHLAEPHGMAAEPLLSFGRGALVHFAVSDRDVQMTTHLDGAATRFLPLDEGNSIAPGHPPHGPGHPNAFLWERFWRRDNWLEILGRYVVGERDATKKLSNIVFPRHHQFDVAQKLQSAVLQDGRGGRYLVQHSAGSGTARSIAWTAQFLAELHDADGKLVFDTVLVLSDRRGTTDQLHDAIFGFARRTGAIAEVDDRACRALLVHALARSERIVVCATHALLCVMDTIREHSADQQKRFAVIADEAQIAPGELKAPASPTELVALREGDEQSAEDLTPVYLTDEDAITFVCFTAAPRSRALQFLRTRPAPFHVYSTHQ